jgi:tryptophanyl-tRNA synthetase
MSKLTMLTGDRPTGPLHIGHYFGSLINRQKYQAEYKTFIMVADVQALTDNWDNPEKVRQNVFEVASDNMAMGLLPDSNLFIQSQIPQIAELTVYFSNLVTINRLKRNPTVKTEIEQKKEKFGNDGESLTFGFLGYPISQAGDIAVVRANIVPVGEDQLPVIEQTQEIVEKFNRIYKQEVFPFPKALLSESPRILGLDGNAKMSKSLNNCIYLKDNEETTTAKIKTAKTDSFSEIYFDEVNRPEISNLIRIYSLVNNISIEVAEKDLKGLNNSAFKQKLAADMNMYFAEFRARRMEIASNSKIVWEKLEQGRQAVLKEAELTMTELRRAMRVDY